MRKLLLALLLCWTNLASAAVISIEFNFTPYVGDPVKSDHVETVPGKALVLINNIPIAEQPVQKSTVPVLFEAREIAAAVWVPASAMGRALRRGKNTIRIEFAPANAKTPYDAQLRWASVTDQVTRTESGSGQVSSTNQSNEGADSKRGVVGTSIFEREFTADFAADQPWHHLPPVTALNDADKEALAALVSARAASFKPDFSAAYQLLQTSQTPGLHLNLEGIRKSKILDKAYAAGIRIAAARADNLDYTVTGNPEVVVRARSGDLFGVDPAAIQRIKGNEMQMGLSMVFAVLYPPRLVAVRDAGGKWTVAY